MCCKWNRSNDECCSKHNKVTKHKLTGNSCCSHKNAGLEFSLKFSKSRGPTQKVGAMQHLNARLSRIVTITLFNSIHMPQKMAVAYVAA